MPRKIFSLNPKGVSLPAAGRFLAALLLSAACLCGAAQAAPIRVVYGFDREFPPFSYEEAGGIPTGFEVELMQAVFRDTPDASLVTRPLNWEMVEVELSAGTINLTTGMVSTEQRKKSYLFSEAPTFPLQIRLFTKTYNRRPSAALLRGEPVSVIKSSFAHRLLQEYGGFNIKAYEGKTDGLRALYNDEVAAYCGPVQNTYFYINKLNYGAVTTVGTPLGITEMRVAVNRDRGDILRMVNEGMARVVESGEYERLYRKWFVRELAPEERSVLLSAAAKAAVPAYVPYAGKGQGAAVLTTTGKIYTACSVENAELSLSLTALRGAVSKAIADGEFELRAAVVADAAGAVAAPEAEDLQVLFEFGRGILVLLEPTKGTYETKMTVEMLASPVMRETATVTVE